MLVSDLSVAEAAAAEIAKQFAETNVEARKHTPHHRIARCAELCIAYRVSLQTLRRVHEEMESVHNVRIKPARDGKSY
jgi:hypothetical protein